MPLDSGGGDGGRRRTVNVLGGALQPCSTAPLTGFYRNGCCQTGTEDVGNHSVCALVTAEFLQFSRARGNDLSTPVPAYGFPGLKPGDRWCLCAPRWQEALRADAAPKVLLRSTEISALADCELDDLKRHAADTE